ncbi:uncharacterized SAM-binding protein YcdF (DUF218 family) [Paenibacillus phyllosphaerae]|uniref:Uncharacterized SAM-binding protein YcdF (DUF218 family) n=1 Tax=Paenibacillus phyllosphaerae TaxID=274593 RepID=A0A7W5AWN1_9BACL|nr:YdcF family protein [Paenibacillus phyllosphaerae]MBB3110165.1 uncharacterized SAM-binding protein YcdF (DUF218 family) [Paenibacillus phyllosphaerae]
MLLRKRVVIRVLLAVVILMAAYVCYSAYNIWSFSSRNELVKSDAALVLGASAWGDEPSPVLRERINHAIELYKQGVVDKIIFTGGKGNEHQMSEAEVSRNYAIKQQVPADDIYIEESSRITEENMRYAKEIALSHGLSTFLLVSDPLHMKRATEMADDFGLTVHSSPTQTSAYKSIRSKLPFFLRELFFYVGYKVTLPFRYPFMEGVE